jgi:prepilin-type N-terminal cleavage/methylation domain-containing protein
MAKMTTHGPRGFTLLELMVVIAVIMVLATIGAEHYERTIALARDAVLRQDLAEMRQAIQNYTRDKEAAPAAWIRSLRRSPAPLARQRLAQRVSAGNIRNEPSTDCRLFLCRPAAAGRPAILRRT